MLPARHIKRAALAALLGAACSVRAQDGKYTSASLKTVGGRGSAMGDAQTAAVDGADAVFWNPSALGGMGRSEVLMMHDRSFDGVNQDAVHFAQPLPVGTLGVGFSMSRLTISQYDVNGAKTRDTWAGDTLFTAAWGRAWKDMPVLSGLETGASLKMFRKKLGEQTSSTPLSADVGLLYQTREGAFQGLRTGLVVQNLGMPVRFSGNSRLPVTTKLGWAWPFAGGLTAALDTVFSAGESPRVLSGLEYRPREVLAFRVGGATGRHPASGLAYGLGVGSGNLHVDYAFVPGGELDGYAHRVSLGFRFGDARD